MLSKIGCIISSCLLVGSCTQSALELPADYGSINSKPLDASMFENADLQLVCSQIDEERNALKNQRVAIRNNIVTSRSGDQIVGYIASVAFPPLWLAVDNQSGQKSQVRSVEHRLDTLGQLTRFKSCLQESQSVDPGSAFERELNELSMLQKQGSISQEEYAVLRLGAFKKHYPEGF
ncbi:MAG: hypothetical protein KUG79_08665 [Pseudomonadales bacterium]|nr:hypothetical protein [Pseudomonadales bacterium]